MTTPTPSARGSGSFRALPREVELSALAPAAPPAAAATPGKTTPATRSLPTLNRDGSRFVVRPRLSPGRFLRRRRLVGYTLIALFVLLPHLRLGGRPPLLVDLVHWEIALLGAVFRPSEGVLLMLLGLAVVLTVFLVTAMWGRVWCGYGCPQTVYLELVFRPIERWLEGTPAQQRQLDAGGGGWRRKLKWMIYAALSFALANVFLSYFVPTELLWRWITHSPAQHPGGFAVVVAVSALMLFDFAWFREQTCTVACPYGRLQAVLLDRRSLVVGYDARRGEPRGKASKAPPARRALPVLNQPASQPAQDPAARATGDCVDCGACVATCPTGIDIRDGLQMECIGCAQCIDACDPIMDKLSRPRGLIRYASQAQLAGAPERTSRARVWIYPALLALVLGTLGWQLAGRGGAKLWVLRADETSAAFQLLGDGRVSSLMRIKIENHGESAHAYELTLAAPTQAGAGAASAAGLAPLADVELLVPQPELRVGGGASAVMTAFAISPASAFRGGVRPVALVVREDGRVLRRLDVTLLGPEALPAGSPRAPSDPAAPAPRQEPRP
jgi:cytochrome c oxidase accessory protein FixG